MSTAANYAKLLEGAAPDVGATTPPPLPRIIEALLFAGDRPLTASLAQSAIPGMNAEEFQAGIDELNQSYRQQARPYVIQKRLDGYAITLRPEFAEIRRRIRGGPRETKLTVPMLDVLAIVAYKQPITRNEIDALRGADSQSILRQLVRLAVISVHNNLPGMKEPAYQTTPRFLEVFELRSLEDLPQTTDLRKI